MIELLSKLDKKYALGLFVGLVFGLLSVYTEFIRTREPLVTYDIISNAPVLDIKEKVSKLSILFDGQDISAKHLKLTVFTIRVINSGPVDITKGMFDNKFPLGCKITGGSLAEKPSLLEYSNEYLTQSVIINIDSSNTISFSEFIFESNEFFIIKLLILHDEASSPEVVPIGKVAGVKRIEVKKSYVEKDSRTFIDKVIDGTLIIHVSRFLLYIITFVIVLIVVLMPIALASDFTEKRRKKKIIQTFRQSYSDQITTKEEIIFKEYLENGDTHLRRARRYLMSPRLLKRELARDPLHPREPIRVRLSEDDLMRSESLLHKQTVSLGTHNFLLKLKEHDVIVQADDSIEVDANFLKALSDFIKFLHSWQHSS